ncbi:hypothetical protein JCGZ_16480 [Jatropha curcas]|uniref:Uncharacterized protein n=1 Tax=Jatropha curcas TaxID=180498 RepID=A0A067JYP7_JATCU|nr:uncharacterized protein LOC105642192 [Jatropha curcas]KDP29091.1 hypothetical protein JCGZ_16480 [Jatropha curcas]
MKLPTKSISSPGRAEKYPPPLMRFLRSNVASRSRGRSRSSPMFVRKKNAAMETQEPSSPKVTCMGQVRDKRSKKAKTTRPAETKSRCKWIRNLLSCQNLSGKLKPKCCKPSWRKWVIFFHLGSKRKTKFKENLSEVEPNFSKRSEHLVQEEEEDEDNRETKVYVSTATSPPKNALLLTRSRSAPYRSSSLASIFWGSSFESEETEQKQSTEQENTEDDSPISKRESVCKESDQESRLDPEIQEKIKLFKEFEGPVTSIRERIMNFAKIEELKTEKSVTERPLILTRCKSEPARTAEKVDPELSFWKKRRLGYT